MIAAQGIAIEGKRAGTSQLGSGNDIGNESALELLDLVLYAQLPTLHPRKLQLIHAAAQLKRKDCRIKVAMFLTQHAKPVTNLLNFNG